MSDDEPGSRLSPEQVTRIMFATRDLDEARETDLGELDVPDLILLVERLRGALDDVLRLVKDVSS
ncbi:hypothetical protein [Streptomyces sp. URMC 124]|uniref:hypothetical protein n=1 Tax=Streptomyces sp. URMC 124 TaxID=3423405 RepID=UPI003F1BCDFC